METVRIRNLQHETFESALVHGAIRAFDLNSIDNHSTGKLAHDDWKDYSMVGHFSVGERLRRDTAFTGEVTDITEIADREAALDSVLREFSDKNLEYSGLPRDTVDEACFSVAPEYHKNAAFFYAGVRVDNESNRNNPQIVYSTRFEEIVLKQIQRSIRISRRIHRIPKRKMEKILHPSKRTLSQLALSAAQVLLPEPLAELTEEVEVRS